MITIDQARIDAPCFPRGQEWWDVFLPHWATATVRDDGTVTLEPSGITMRYSTERGVWYEPHPDQSAAARKRREKTVAEWIGRLPRIAVAIIDS